MAVVGNASNSLISVSNDDAAAAAADDDDDTVADVVDVDTCVGCDDADVDDGGTEEVEDFGA